MDDLTKEQLADKQVEWYFRAFHTDPNRREALIKLARFYKYNNRPSVVIALCKAAMEIPITDYYANDKSMYEQEPHELLYWAYGWMGDIPNAKKHILIALDYQIDNPVYLRDTQYYFGYASPKLDGWMTFKELTFLYDTAKRMESVIELGSWKGKSTHALCSSGCPKVTAIDTFMGSVEEPEAHAEAKDGSIFNKFIANVGHFKNLTYIQTDINDAVNDVPDRSVDMVFIDAGHTYKEVQNDIRKWRSKAKILLCGHDYVSVWEGVMQAVDEELGGPDFVVGTIWGKWINNPRVSICIPNLGRPEKLHRLLTTIKENAGYDNYEVIVQTDKPIPNNEGVPKTLRKAVERSNGDLVMFLANDVIPEKNFLQEAVWAMARHFPDMDGLVGANNGQGDAGNAIHWLASKSLLPMLGGDFFYTGYYHNYCDNELTERCKAIGKYFWAEKFKLIHDHPFLYGVPSDDVYEMAYRKDRVEHDRLLFLERNAQYLS